MKTSSQEQKATEPFVNFVACSNMSSASVDSASVFSCVSLGGPITSCEEVCCGMLKMKETLSPTDTAVRCLL